MRLMLLFILLALGRPAFAAELSLADIEDRWVHIRYEMTDTKARLAESLALQQDSAAFLNAHPDMTEAKVWHALVLLLEAEYRHSLGSLPVVRKAKVLLEEAEAQNPTVMDGRIYTTLGTLYAEVPGWPVGFGDDTKAAAYFRKGLEVSPQGLESNYLYGDFLAGRGKAADALPYYEAALRAPLRADHEHFDAYRHKEVETDLTALQAKARVPP